MMQILQHEAIDNRVNRIPCMAEILTTVVSGLFRVATRPVNEQGERP